LVREGPGVAAPLVGKWHLLLLVVDVLLLMIETGPTV